jgi:hypothetical protein
MNYMVKGAEAKIGQEVRNVLGSSMKKGEGRVAEVRAKVLGSKVSSNTGKTR